MRKIVLGLATLAALATAGIEAHAFRGWYPWCAYLSDQIEAGTCGYVTLQQCMTTVRGVGGYCGINPYPSPPVSYSRSRRGYAYR
jgi:Protein of unknown function (DUF3551)